MITDVSFKLKCDDVDPSSLAPEYTNFLVKEAFKQIAEGIEYGNMDGDLNIPLSTTEGTTTVYGWWAVRYP